MRKPQRSVRLFESDFMEKFSHVHPITPLVVYAPIISWLIFHSASVRGLSLTSIAGMGLLGLFTWTLAEYLLHRYVFHYRGKSAFSERLHYIIHGNHHDVADDPTRLVMPPLPGLIIASVLFVLFRGLLGEVWVEPFFALFLVGYLCYDYTHFAVHHFAPRTAFGKAVKQHHMMHHFVTPEARWGVSSPFWDYVFGTLEPKKETRKSTA